MEAKWSKTENYWKRNKAKKRRFNFALVERKNLKRKEAEKKVDFVSLWSETKMEANQKIIETKTWRKNAVLTSLRLDAKTLNWKEANFFFFFRVSVRNWSRFALKQKNIFCETGAPYFSWATSQAAADTFRSATIQLECCTCCTYSTSPHMFSPSFSNNNHQAESEGGVNQWQI